MRRLAVGLCFLAVFGAGEGGFQSGRGRISERAGADFRGISRIFAAEFVDDKKKLLIENK